MIDILQLANLAISIAALVFMAGGVIYLLALYRRTMRQYKQQMEQAIGEMRRQNDALERLVKEHDGRLARLEA